MEKTILNKEKINGLLDIIMEIIYFSNNKYNNAGLLSGIMGESIFIQRYSIVRNKNYQDRLEDNINLIYEKIEENKVSSTYCSGIAGISLGLDYIYEKQFRENHISFDFISSDIEEFLFIEMKNFINDNNFDFLHGALGIGFYFLEKVKKGDSDSEYKLDYIVEAIIKSSIEDGKNIFKWEDKNKLTNISLSHGMSSILIFLLEIYNHKSNLRLEKYIKGGVQFILKQKLEQNEFISLFPSSSKEFLKKEIKGSRLGWCYGDLGIAILFRKYNDIFNDKDIYRIYEEILDHSSNRRSYKESLVMDVSICHGSIGIAMIFLNEYMRTKKIDYIETATYWLNKSIKMLELDITSTFFNVLTMKNESPTNLLEGLSGIGLVLLDFLHPDERDWNKFLLL